VTASVWIPNRAKWWTLLKPQGRFVLAFPEMFLDGGAYHRRLGGEFGGDGPGVTASTPGAAVRDG
jgi:hypothetical protein